MIWQRERLEAAAAAAAAARAKGDDLCATTAAGRGLLEWFETGGWSVSVVKRRRVVCIVSEASRGAAQRGDLCSGGGARSALRTCS